MFKKRICCRGTTWRTYGNANLTLVVVFKGDSDDLGFGVLLNPGLTSGHLTENLNFLAHRTVATLSVTPNLDSYFSMDFTTVK